MKHLVEWRCLRTLCAALLLALGCAAAEAQTSTPTPSAPTAQAPTAPKAQAPTAPKAATTPPADDAPATPDSKTPSTPVPPPTPAPPTLAPPAPTPPVTPAPTPPAPTPPAPTTAPAPGGATPLAPAGKPSPTEIEPNASPTTPETATTETVTVPARPVAMLSGDSSYDDAFKTIKTSIETLKKAMDKAGLKPAGHPITIFSAPDDKGFKYEAAIPIAAKPDGRPDLGDGISFGETPSGKALKFQHRGAYEDIDATYDVITAYLDNKGLQVDNPYIEEYLTDLTTEDDPNLQVDIYVFIK